MSEPAHVSQAIDEAIAVLATLEATRRYVEARPTRPAYTPTTKEPV